jgi:hypothetical protein
VTIIYNFKPFTPLIRQVVGTNIHISAAAVFRTEY